MKTKQLMQMFSPIERVNDEERIVEGYAFVNEVVEGEGGMRLMRSAMKDATADYMRWGAVREMHQPSAVGTALGVEWMDDGRCLLRAKIVDDQAWNKVKEGVYKGFSIGVRPTLIRGKDVHAVTWVENSLVDRPKDPDAVLTLARWEDGEADTEAEIDPEAETDANPEDAPLSRSEFAAAMEEMLERIQGLAAPSPQTDQADLLARLEKAEADLAAEKAARAEAERRAEAAAKRPMLNTAAVERTFHSPGGQDEDGASVEAEIERILSNPGETPQERYNASLRISALRAGTQKPTERK